MMCHKTTREAASCIKWHMHHERWRVGVQLFTIQLTKLRNSSAASHAERVSIMKIVINIKQTIHDDKLSSCDIVGCHGRKCKRSVSISSGDMSSSLKKKTTAKASHAKVIEGSSPKSATSPTRKPTSKASTPKPIFTPTPTPKPLSKASSSSLSVTCAVQQEKNRREREKEKGMSESDGDERGRGEEEKRRRDEWVYDRG
ncbi:hypothetical protein DFH29DRAFT_882358 [Suillus ampliporus]|nr:hypothetical protein DFH29DRAFT_882358 [Suillus ampliporus]